MKVHRHATRDLHFVDHCDLPHLVPQVELLPFDTSFQANTYATLPVLERKLFNLLQPQHQGD